MVEYFKKVLEGEGEVHAVNSEETYAMRIADQFAIAPRIYNESYIQFLIEYCEVKDIKAIIPLFDIDLPILAQHKELFEGKGIRLVISDFLETKICNDKWLTYKFLIDNSFSTPATFVDIDECKNALAAGKIDFPLIIKPRWGMGSKGIFEAENLEELEVLYLKTRREIERTYLRFESVGDTAHAIIIQEKLMGQEYGIDVFNDLKAKHVCTIPKKKIAMRAGETDVAEVIDDPNLEELGLQLSLKLQHIGNLDVDVFLVNDNWYVLELNARFGGQYPFSHLAGANFPKVIIDLLKDNPIDPRDLEFEYNVKGFKDFSIKRVNIGTSVS